jgi:hypothetical protein
LLAATQPWLLLLWIAGAGLTLHRLLQRQPRPEEVPANPRLAYLAAWSATSLAGAAAGGRSFDHYAIQFLPPLCLGLGLAIARAAELLGKGRPLLLRVVTAGVLLLAGLDLATGTWRSRARTLPLDPSLRVSAYIREHSRTTDRIFVWGYHPDIYLYSDRKPASRFLYASFLTGLIPWTNTAPDRDTRYAVVPGTMAQLLHDLERNTPRFIVDCSAGPNRYWQKYPLQDFPGLDKFVRTHYRQVEPHVFVPQGFRLYQRLEPGEAASAELNAGAVPAEVAAAMKLGTAGSPLLPIRASAPHGMNLSMSDGHLEYFAHAPSSLIYRLPPQAAALRGGFGFRPGAYAPENRGPTDGAEFIIRWRPDGGTEQVLLRRLLRPREQPADRGIQSFRVEIPNRLGGELELAITMGPADNSASDWTFWSDLLLENSH